MNTLPARAFPALDARTLTTLLFAGFAADVTWEFWARLITPLLAGDPLEPAALIESVFGFQNRPLAEMIHLLVGFVLYPVGYIYVFRPVVNAVAHPPWYVTSTLYGVGLWIFALFVMAGLIAGLPWFLGFGPLTWASLIGHVLFGLVAGLVVEIRE